jgi:GPI-anchor transamidase subunit GAA1
MESSLRMANNLLERLHASFFFYLLTGPVTFVVIGKYLTSAVLVGIGMELNGLQAWVASGWEGTRRGSSTIWQRRRRPLLPVLGVMLATHAVGYTSLLFMTSRIMVDALEVCQTSLCLHSQSNQSSPRPSLMPSF